MAPSLFYIYAMATSFFYIYAMATSFFYIYAMATSFFYIYINIDIDIDIDITFTNWRSVQSFYWTPFLLTDYAQPIHGWCKRIIPWRYNIPLPGSEARYVPLPGEDAVFGDVYGGSDAYVKFDILSTAEPQYHYLNLETSSRG